MSGFKVVSGRKYADKVREKEFLLSVDSKNCDIIITWELQKGKDDKGNWKVPSVKEIGHYHNDPESKHNFHVHIGGDGTLFNDESAGAAHLKNKGKYGMPNDLMIAQFLLLDTSINRGMRFLFDQIQATLAYFYENALRARQKQIAAGNPDPGEWIVSKGNFQKVTQLQGGWKDLKEYDDRKMPHAWPADKLSAQPTSIGFYKWMLGEARYAAYALLYGDEDYDDPYGFWGGPNKVPDKGTLINMVKKAKGM